MPHLKIIDCTCTAGPMSRISITSRLALSCCGDLARQLSGLGLMEVVVGTWIHGGLPQTVPSKTSAGGRADRRCLRHSDDGPDQECLRCGRGPP